MLAVSLFYWKRIYYKNIMLSLTYRTYTFFSIPFLALFHISATLSLSPPPHFCHSLSLYLLSSLSLFLLLILFINSELFAENYFYFTKLYISCTTTAQYQFQGYFPRWNGEQWRKGLELQKKIFLFYTIGKEKDNRKVWTVWTISLSPLFSLSHSLPPLYLSLSSLFSNLQTLFYAFLKRKKIYCPTFNKALKLSRVCAVEMYTRYV